MSLSSLRDWIDSFLGALEEERHQMSLAQRREPGLGALYQDAAALFSVGRITELQRLLAGTAGVEEKRIRALLEFLAHGRARCVAAEALDRRHTWEIYGSVEVAGSRIPCRQVSAALGIAGDRARRVAIEDAYLEALDENRDIAEESIARQREGVEELGYGPYVESCEILGGLDLRGLAREGERFVRETEALYTELLAWYLPRLAEVEPPEARRGDLRRLVAAPAYDSLLAAEDTGGRVRRAVEGSGLDPLAEGRIRIEPDALLAGEAGAVCHPYEVPDSVAIVLSTRSGRHATESVLSAFGVALHAAYTAAELPVEHRRLGDGAVPHAWGGAFAGLMANRVFLVREFSFPRSQLAEYLRFAALLLLYHLRRDIAQLRFELAYFNERAGEDRFSELMEEATGVRQDGRAAPWVVEPGFASARRVRGAKLAALLAAGLRERFDEDWYRHPRAGAFLRDQFSHGRLYSAPELAVQLSSAPLDYASVRARLAELTG